jgi:hypothetical protein
MPLDLTLDGLIGMVVEDTPTGEVLDRLATAAASAAELGELGDALLGYFVDRCRRDGRSWSDIGASLGVTKQAVQKRFVARSGATFTLERFTDRARRVLDHANEAARALGHNFRGTEHLLLGLFDEPDALAARILGKLGTTRADVEREVVSLVPRSPAVPAGDLPMTPRAERALALTVAQAVELGHNYIGTEHLLLGLLREQEGVAARVLTEIGVAEERVRAETIELLSGYRPGPAQ